MRSEIRSIRTVPKSGPGSDPSRLGFLVYGRRPDNKTGRCQLTVAADGTVVVSSTWRSPDCRRGEVEECRSEFTASEWAQICGVAENLGPHVCNRILDKREKKEGTK